MLLFVDRWTRRPPTAIPYWPLTGVTLVSAAGVPPIVLALIAWRSVQSAPHVDPPASPGSVTTSVFGLPSATAKSAALSQRNAAQLSSDSTHCTCRVCPAEVAA